METTTQREAALTAAAEPSTPPTAPQPRLRFSSVPGFFADYAAIAQSNPDGRCGTLPNFGLLPETHDYQPLSWSRMPEILQQMNHGAPNGTSYRVIFYTRHGQGFHNVKEAEVGTAEWDAHWSLLEGDGTITWADAELTAEGIRQAEEVGRAWCSSIRRDPDQVPRDEEQLTAVPDDQQIPFPGTIYTSPLRRCLATTRLCYSRASSLAGREFSPLVKEFLRERLTDHTCDRRSTRSWIEANYPEFRISSASLSPSSPSSGFAEEDPVWRADRIESIKEHAVRKQAVLEEIWAELVETQESSNAFISIVSHSMALSAMLKVLGAADFRAREATTLGLLVKAEAIDPCP